MSKLELAPNYPKTELKSLTELAKYHHLPNCSKFTDASLKCNCGAIARFFLAELQGIERIIQLLSQMARTESPKEAMIQLVIGSILEKVSLEITLLSKDFNEQNKVVL
jgi:hypothetical protein